MAVPHAGRAQLMKRFRPGDTNPIGLKRAKACRGLCPNVQSLKVAGGGKGASAAEMCTGISSSAACRASHDHDANDRA